MILPNEHLLQHRLFNESHARPYAEITVIVSLMSYVAKSLKAIDIDLFVGGSIAVVILSVWFAVRQIKSSKKPPLTDLLFC